MRVNINDSIRLTEVIKIDKEGLLQNDIDKYYAALIYLHGGGPSMKDDSIYILRAISLCNEIINSGINNITTDTLSLRNLAKNEIFKLFKEDIYLNFKIDTLFDSSQGDTLIIINYPLKVAAESIKNLAYNSFSLQYNSRNEKESIDLNKLDEPEYQEIIRAKIRAKIIKNLEERNPKMLKSMTEEKINKLIENEIQSLRNFKKSIIEDIKANPEKYK
ncbi:MAG: hypothetical protein ABIK31_07050 [candidate division WOR-3 bacterium]